MELYFYKCEQCGKTWERPPMLFDEHTEHDDKLVESCTHTTMTVCDNCNRKWNWWDEWKITHDLAGAGVWTIEFPHSKAKEKSITIKGKYTKKHVEWLISFLDVALTEISRRDKLHESKTK